MPGVTQSSARKGRSRIVGNVFRELLSGLVSSNAELVEGFCWGPLCDGLVPVEEFSHSPDDLAVGVVRVGDQEVVAPVAGLQDRGDEI